MGKIYNESYNQAKWIFKLFMEDKLEIKKFFYKILDFITLNINFKFSNCSLNIEKIDKSFLNLNNNNWYNIANKCKIRNESWNELYAKALKK